MLPRRFDGGGGGADELIRQVTINCAERGLLLYRVRDEIRETLDAYQRLYTSSCAYGVRKALMVRRRDRERGRAWRWREKRGRKGTRRGE